MSPSQSLRLKVRKAVKHIRAFERALFDEARQEKTNGVVCGHIHHPTIIDIDGFRYVNTGDWVESCTAVVEHHSGELEILRWPAVVVERTVVAAPALLGEAVP